MVFTGLNSHRYQEIVLNRISKISIVIVLLAGSFFLSCGMKFNTHEEPTLEEIIAIGKTYLMQNKGVAAAEAFRAARSLDSLNTDANFGLIAANTMAFVNMVDTLIETLGGLFTGEIRL